MGEREIKAFALAPLPVLVPLLFATGVNAVVGDMGDATGADIFLAMLALVLFGYGAAFLIGIRSCSFPHYGSCGERPQMGR